MTTVKVLIISHDEVGAALLQAAKTILGELPLPTTLVEVKTDCDPDVLTPKLQCLCNGLEAHQELLILTDLFGATPSNIAARLQLMCCDRVSIVTGLNLPMLIRVMNYSRLGLKALTKKALSGGKDGVLNCSKGYHDQT